MLLSTAVISALTGITVAYCAVNGTDIIIVTADVHYELVVCIVKCCVQCI